MYVDAYIYMHLTRARDILSLIKAESPINVLSPDARFASRKEVQHTVHCNIIAFVGGMGNSKTRMELRKAVIHASKSETYTKACNQCKNRTLSTPPGVFERFKIYAYHGSSYRCCLVQR